MNGWEKEEERRRRRRRRRRTDLGVVLEGSTRHEHAVLVPVLLEAGLGDDLEAFVQFAPPVPQSVGLIDDDGTPRNLGCIDK